MAAIANLEGKRQVRASKLEQTILANRGMNFHLKRRLNIIEVDRKRTLKFVDKRRKELQADLKAKKDEKFNVMLKHQMQKTARGGRRKNSDPSRDDVFGDDIEGALFTNGLMNAPGVHSRMKRLEHRRRILPDFEDDSENEDNVDQDGTTDVDHAAPDQKVVTTPEIAITPPYNGRRTSPFALETTTIYNEKTNHNGKVKPHHLHDDEEMHEAVVLMTSGVVSLIGENAELKLNTQNKVHQDNHDTNGVNTPAPITGFGVLSQMRSRTAQITPANGLSMWKEREFTTNSKKKRDRTKSVQFSRHRGSLDDIDGLFGTDPDERTETRKFRKKSGQTRLSIVKSKLESNEKDFLMKLRIQSQKLENEDVARRVWEFIGRRPTSMFSPSRIPQKSDEVQDDVLSETEEERNMTKFTAIASVTSKKV